MFDQLLGIFARRPEIPLALCRAVNLWIEGVLENDEEKVKLAFVQGSIDAKRAGLLRTRGG